MFPLHSPESMKTFRRTIQEKRREHPVAGVKPEDFATERGPEIDPLEVLRDPRFTLYCFDRKAGAALFVECEDPEEIDRAAFYYQAQAEAAIGLVEMPLETFHRIAAEIPPPPRGLIFVHSVGRCGSTLLSKVLESVPGVQSLSEPDDLTQLVHWRAGDGASDEELHPLITSSTRWRGKPRFGTPAERVAIKTRSEVLVLADLIGTSFPQAKHFFLYRDAVAWMRTLFRGWPLDRDVYDEALNRKMEEGWSRTLPIFREYRRPEAALNPIQIRILAWITCMEGYLDLLDMGIPICAARFEDLTSDPLDIIQRLFAFCDIEGVDWEEIRGVLSRDSQAGTVYDREQRYKQNRVLPPELEQDLRNVIATRPRLRTPNVIVPGTLLPS